MLVFVAFRRLAGIQPGNVPEPILVFAAVLPWQFFSTALSDSSVSLLGNSNLISKVYFPRLLIPGAAVVTALVDFLITLGLLAALMFWYGVAPGWQVLTLPVFVLLTLCLSLGSGLFLSLRSMTGTEEFSGTSSRSSFNSGFSFPTHRIHDGQHPRPLASVVCAQSPRGHHRWVPLVLLSGYPPIDPQELGLSVVIVGSFLWSGVWYFRRMERSFADVI